MERVEIQPAAVAQVHRSLKTGKRILIGDDVQNVARDLRVIRDTLKLEYDPAEDIFVVLETVVREDGSIEDKLVTSWDPVENGGLDQRLVRRVQEIAAPGYNLGAELEKADRAADRAVERQVEEQVGPAAERLAHALRKDLGMKPRVFVPTTAQEA